MAGLGSRHDAGKAFTNDNGTINPIPTVFYISTPAPA